MYSCTPNFHERLRFLTTSRIAVASRRVFSQLDHDVTSAAATRNCNATVKQNLFDVDARQLSEWTVRRLCYSRTHV